MSRQSWALAAALAVLLAGAGCGDDDEPATTTSAEVTTTTTGDTSTTAPPPNEAAERAVWPLSAGATFSTPADAARSFAVDYLGMPEPTLSAFQSGDTRSGEIVIRPRTGQGPGKGPPTTVLLRQLSDDNNWSVIGCHTDSLRLESHQPGDVVTSPVRLKGQSTAFEAQFLLGIREDGMTKEQFLAQDHTMGGSNGDFGPFDATLTFRPPTRPRGAIVLFQLSAENGELSEATVVRVALS